MKIRMIVEDGDIAMLLDCFTDYSLKFGPAYEESGIAIPSPVDWAQRMVRQAYEDALEDAEMHMHEHGCEDGFCEKFEVN